MTPLLLLNLFMLVFMRVPIEIMYACRERQRFGKSMGILQKRRRRRRKKSRGPMTTVVQGTYTVYHRHYSYPSLPTDINYTPD